MHIINKISYLKYALYVGFSCISGHALAGQSFYASCGSLTITNSILKAQCTADNGNQTWSVIDLSPYINIINNQLAWSKTGNSSEIDSCEVSETGILICEIQDSSDKQSFTGLNLNQHIYNINGILTYQ